MGAEVEPWWRAAFRADYLAAYAHRDVDAARREARALAQAGLAPSGARVLDLCCGQGRHVLALRELGYAAIGLDQSAELLAAARSLDGGAALDGRLARADARALPLAGASCAAAVLLFTSFGYAEEEDDLAVLRELARVLARRAWLVLDLAAPARVRSALVEHSARRAGELAIDERRWLEDRGRRVCKEVRVARPDGRRAAWTERVRLYEADELGALLARAGFRAARVWGDFGGARYERGGASERLIAWARAPES